MLKEVERKVAEFFAERPEIAGAESLLTAVSGGSDSTALVSAMSRLKEHGVFGGRVICVHINHQLRGAEAEADERFVDELAARFGFKCVTSRVDVKGYVEEKGVSVETAARELRIKVLLETALKYECKWIATAHQKNDNAETLLHRLGRGTGFRGLCGIWPVKGFGDGVSFIRPMLEMTREEIVSYLEQSGLEWRTDETNSQCIYTRNIIRHRILPQLQKACGGSVVDDLSKLACSAMDLQRRISAAVGALWNEYAEVNRDGVAIRTDKIFEYLPLVWVEVFRKAFIAVGCGERRVRESHYDRIFGLAKNRDSGKVIELPNGFSVSYWYGKLFFARSERQTCERLKSEAVKLDVPGEARFGSYVIKSELLMPDEGQISEFKKNKDGFVEWFDPDKIVGGLEVRSARRGDSFVPLGQKSGKKVAKFLSDRKVGREARREAFIVCDGEKIIWLAPFRVSDEVKLGPRAEKVVQLRVSAYQA